MKKVLKNEFHVEYDVKKNLIILFFLSTKICFFCLKMFSTERLLAPSHSSPTFLPYLYDLLHESPFKTLLVLTTEITIALIHNIMVTTSIFIYFYFFEDEASFYNECLSYWLLFLLLMNAFTIFPKYFLLKHLDFIQKIYNGLKVNDPAEAKNLIKFEIWRLFLSKIFFINHFISNIIFCLYLLGMVFILVELFAVHTSSSLLNFACFKMILLATKNLVAQKMIFNIMNEEENAKNIKITKKILKKEEYSSIKKDEILCSICLMEFNPSEMVSETDCKHFFHDECLEGWLKIKNKCPMCNKN